jgi:hypothetical protein
LYSDKHCGLRFATSYASPFLLQANPKTDFNCLNDFGSFFRQDIPIPAGTIIDFRRTEDGQLITEIGGNLIGAVRSKDLCS